MKVLFRTERTPAVSKDLGLGRAAAAGIAWFELVLHEGPPDEGWTTSPAGNGKTWDGGGQTVAYWRTQFARMRDPYPWTVASGMEGVAPAVIPDEIVSGLPDDARISFL